MRKILPFCSSFFLFGLLTLISRWAGAQDTVTKYIADSTVVVIQDSRLDALIKRQKNANLIKQTMPGYRIQIYFGGVRQKASEIKSAFADKHNDVSAYLTYQQPNFKVRVGDFRTRLEAQRFLKSMEGEYTTMFIVPDEVKLPPINNQFTNDQLINWLIDHW